MPCYHMCTCLYSSILEYYPNLYTININDNGTDNTRNNEWLFNFGNPAYTNSSSVSDASGFGDFEYTVPTGFYSYCTKNLANFG